MEATLGGVSEVPAALVLGWLADRAAGDPVRGHPVAAFGRLAGGVEARVWRPVRLAGAFHALLCVTYLPFLWIARMHLTETVTAVLDGLTDNGLTKGKRSP